MKTKTKTKIDRITNLLIAIHDGIEFSQTFAISYIYGLLHINYIDNDDVESLKLWIKDMTKKHGE